MSTIFLRSVIFILLSSSLCAQTKIREGSQTMGALPTAQGGVATGGTTGQVLQKSSNTDYDYSWGSIVTGVSSWNSRTGAVVPVSGDYTFAGLDFTSSDLSSIETRSYNDLQDLPVLFFGNHLISGGGVAWTGTGYNYIVSTSIYVIGGTQYASTQTPVTLDPSDPSLARVDVFIVDDTGTASVITGTPGGPPLEPSIDPATQLRLTAVNVPASSTEPSVTSVNIYLENTEWTTSTNSAGTINLASTSNPYAGTKDIEGTSTITGNLFTAVKPSGTLSLSDYESLVLHIRSKGAWSKNKSLQIFWLSGSTSVGSAIALKDGAFGFDSSNTSSYQQIVIPTALFNSGLLTVDRVRVQVAGGGASIGWYIDNVMLQSGGGGGGGGSGGDFSTNVNVSVPNEVVLFADTSGKLGTRSTGTGIATLTSGVLGTTPLSGTIGGFDANGNGAPVLTGVKSYFVSHKNATITGYSIIGVGSSPTCTIDVWKIAAGTVLPTVTNTITASAKPALSTGNVLEADCPAACSGWTITVNDGDIFGYKIDAVSNADRVIFQLKGVPR